MGKLAWVLLPLALAGLLAGLFALAGRRGSRHQLNVAVSLLLLGYLLATAGLGIFWVANQQLPVFDWHYLFGYATLGLVLIHLAFNFRIVWRTLVAPLRRERQATRQADTPPRRGTRHGIAARRHLTHLLLTGGGAAALGFLAGRGSRPDERATDAASDPVDRNTPDGAARSIADHLAEVERYHAMSSHSRAGVLVRAPSIDWGRAPPPFKALPGERLPLPEPRPGEGLARVATLLWHTAGITQRRGGLALRASPASGALFSTELYLVSRGMSGVPAGLWHHDAQHHALVRLPRPLPDDDLALGAPPDVDAAQGLCVLVSAVFRRTGHKYRDRAYRYLWADLGHALENLRQAAVACGLQAVLLPAFDGPRAAKALGLDEAEEGVLAWVVVRPAAQADAGREAATWGSWAPVAAPRDPVLGLTGTVHARTSLQRAAVAGAAHPPSAALRPSSSEAPSPASPAALIALPAPRPHGRDALSLIAARRSQRRFSARALPLPTLSSLLAGLALPPVLSPALRIDLVAHAVQGLAPGAYRYLAGPQGLQRRAGRGGARSLARAAALDQDVIGDAAAVLVLSADRTVLAADPLGPLRGYRHAFLEAGLVGERIYLEATARGLGACAVGAYHDDEAAALVGLDLAQEWPLHFAALGWPG